MAVFAIAASSPAPVAGQSVATVEGRVVEAGTPNGIPNAVVELGDHGAVLTTVTGAFRFDNVLPKAYVLRVEAFGYVAHSQTVMIEGDTRVDVSLHIDPVLVDSLVVRMETIDFDGRVVDPHRGIRLMDAHVLSNQGHDESTNRHGRFDLDDVFDGAPLRISVRAMGYMPLDTTFLPDHQERYDFKMRPDPIMTRMIEGQIQKLEERAGDRLYKYRAPFNRDDMVRHMGNGTLATMLESRYPLHILRRVGCVIFDERHESSRDRRRFLLENTFPEELERAEILEFPGPGRLLMLRVYTREFFLRMMASDKPLRKPYMSTTSPLVCR